MSLPPPDEWTQRPLLLRWSPRPMGSSNPKTGELLKINSERTIPFETELFKGEFHLSIRYTNNSEFDPWGPGKFCEGRQRKIVVYVQGQFKKKLSFDDVFFGFVWPKPLKPPKGAGIAMSVCESFSPGTISDIHAEEPYLLNMIAGGADNVHVWRPEDPPEAKLPAGVPNSVYERAAGDMPKFKSMKERAKWMNKKHSSGNGINAAHCFYEPGWTYSFEFYTHLLFMNLFEVHFPLGITFWRVHLEDYLAGQPYPIVARTKKGELLWDLEVWHEKTTPKTAPEVWRKGPPPAVDPHEVDDVLTPVGEIDAAKETQCDESSDGGTSEDESKDDGNASVSDDGFQSCEEASESDFLSGGGELPRRRSSTHVLRSSSSKIYETGVPEPGAQSPESSILIPPPPKQNELGIVLWPGKRLRLQPKTSASWATKRKEIPQGCQVKCIRTTNTGWTNVELPNAVTGWIQTRHLGKPTGSYIHKGEEPRTALVCEKRKRVRASPQPKVRRHGAYLSRNEEVHVIAHTGHWALIVPNNGPAGWLKASNLRFLPDTPEPE